MEGTEQLAKQILSFKKGGSGIHIKKANRGKFTDYCGGKVTSECIARGKRSSNPAIRKRATFAANARKGKHQEGGIVESDPDIRYAKEGVTDGLTKRKNILDKNVADLKQYVPENDKAEPYVDPTLMFNSQINRAKDANVQYVNELKQQYGKDILGLTLDSGNLDKLKDVPAIVYRNRLANIPNISINESKDYSMGTIVHELTHGLGATPQEAAIAKYMQDKKYLVSPKSNGDESEEYYKYLDEVPEIYSRRNEVLHWYDKEPDYKYNKKDLEKMRKLIDDKNLNEGFLKRYDDDFLLYLMNDVAANNKKIDKTAFARKGGCIPNGVYNRIGGTQGYTNYKMEEK